MATVWGIGFYTGFSGLKGVMRVLKGVYKSTRVEGFRASKSLGPKV